MKEKRRDNKGRILHTGESQRTDGKYLYKYVDAFGNTKYVYAWRLTPTDPTPKGKREKPSLRELEQQIRRDIEDGIDSTGKKMTLCQLYAKQNAQWCCIIKVDTLFSRILIYNHNQYENRRKTYGTESKIL